MERIIDIKEQAIHCYFEMYRALTTKDSVALAEMLDEDFTLIHVNGASSTKEEYVGNISDGSLRFHSVEHESILANTEEDPITVKGKSQTDVTAANGERKIWRLEQELDLVYKENKWLITQARASVY